VTENGAGPGSQPGPVVFNDHAGPVAADVDQDVVGLRLRFKPGFQGMCLFPFGPVNPVGLGQAEMAGLAFVSAFLTLVA